MSTPSLVTGCDVVDIARLTAALDRRAGLLARLFTPREILDARRGGVRAGSETERHRLAARFAAKEATRKALGELRLPFHAVEVRSAPSGAPQLWLHGRRSSLACSLSHDAGVAMAVVVGFAPDTAPETTSAAAAGDLPDVASEVRSGAVTPPDILPGTTRPPTPR